MNGFVRQAYGRSGTRLDGVLVAFSPAETVSATWLRLAMALLWVLIAMAFARYTLPGVTGKDTVIDISRLAGRAKLPEPQIRERTVRPAKKLPPPPPLPVTEAPRMQVEKPQAPPLAPRLEEPRPPLITRPLQRKPDLEAPAKVRTPPERMVLGEESSDAPSARIVRGSPPRKAAVETRAERKIRELEVPFSPAEERVSIQRQPGTHASAREYPALRPQMARQQTGRETGVGPVARIERRAPAVSGNLSATPSPRRQMARLQVGEETGAVPAARIQRSLPAVSDTQGRSATDRAMERKRGALPIAGDGSGEPGGGKPRGQVRGVPFQSLDICPNVRDEEEKVRKVLAVVGARSSCGEYRFMGAERISSFNMLIDVPKGGRRLSNRCEELDYAFKCLTKNR